MTPRTDHTPADDECGGLHHTFCGKCAVEVWTCVCGALVRADRKHECYWYPYTPPESAIEATEATNASLGAVVGVNYYPGVECEHGFDFCPQCDQPTLFDPRAA